MKKRLHRISYLSKPFVEKEDDHFRVKYPSKRVASSIHDILSDMGWKSLVDGQDLLVFTSIVSSTDKEKVEVKDNEEIVHVEVKSELEVSKDNPVFSPPVAETIATNIDPFEQIRKFVGSKDEAIEKLQKIYLSPSFNKFSHDGRQKITDALKEHWAEEHPEDYALSIVEFLVG